MPNVSWNEISELRHLIAEERGVIQRAIMRLTKADERLYQFNERINELIHQHQNEET